MTGPRSRAWVGLALGSFWISTLGCDGDKPAPPGGSGPSPDPAAVRADGPGSRTFEAGAEIPPATFPFEGSPGFVRVTVEAETSSGSARASSLNDVLFEAKGRGRIIVSFRKPWPGHDEGRVTVRCESGGEDSTAEFEPSLWFRDGGAAVAFQAHAPGEPGPVADGAEVVLAHYAAKVGNRAVGLTIRATFAGQPPPVRLQGRAEGL